MNSPLVSLIKEKVFIPLLIITIAFISFLPLLYTYFNTPKDLVFTGINRWSEDYYGYLAHIERGKRGDIILLNAPPNAETITVMPSLAHEELVLLGHIARVLNLSSSSAYHLSRFLLSLAFLFVSWFFIRSQVPKRIALFTFLLAFTVGSFPNLSDLVKAISGTIPIDTVLYPLVGFTEFDVVTRSSRVPHYQIGSICFLIILLCLKKSEVQTDAGNLIKLAISAFILSVLQPVNTSILYLAIGIYGGIQSIIVLARKNTFFEKRKRIIKLLIPIAVVISSSIPVIFHYRYVLSRSFLNSIAPTASVNWHIIPQDLPFAIGPIFFLGILGMLLYFSKYSYLLSSWLIAQTLAFFFLYKVFAFEQNRALLLPFYLPLAIFSALLVDSILKTFSRNKEKVYNFSLFVCYFLLFTSTLVPVVSSIRIQTYTFTNYKDFPSFHFPTKKQVEAFTFLEKNTNPNDLVLALYEGTFLIPAFSGNPIALGENYAMFYKNFSERVQRRNAFLTGFLNENQAKDFLSRENISFIYWGYQEKNMGGNLRKYSFLSPVFDNGQVVIFKIRERDSSPGGGISRSREY